MGGSASVRATTRVNVEQASKRVMRKPASVHDPGVNAFGQHVSVRGEFFMARPVAPQRPVIPTQTTAIPTVHQMTFSTAWRNAYRPSTA